MGSLLWGIALLFGTLPAQQKPNPKKGLRRALLCSNKNHPVSQDSTLSKHTAIAHACVLYPFEAAHQTGGCTHD